MRKPEIGNKIYVHDGIYNDLRSDKFIGGIATVSGYSFEEDEDEKIVYYVTIEENFTVAYEWETLLLRQEEYKNKYGNKKAGYL